MYMLYHWPLTIGSTEAGGLAPSKHWSRAHELRWLAHHGAGRWASLALSWNTFSWHKTQLTYRHGFESRSDLSFFLLSYKNGLAQTNRIHIFSSGDPVPKFQQESWKLNLDQVLPWEQKPWKYQRWSHLRLSWVWNHLPFLRLQKPWRDKNKLVGFFQHLDGRTGTHGLKMSKGPHFFDFPESRPKVGEKEEKFSVQWLRVSIFSKKNVAPDTLVRLGFVRLV